MTASSGKKYRPRIVVMISGGGTNLQALIDGCASGMIKGDIVRVISSNASAYGLERARLAGIEGVALPKKAFADEAACHAARHEALLSARPDLVVLAGYLGILPSETLRALACPVINTHPALLPSFGGKGMYGHHVHEAVLRAGRRVSGATVHRVTAGIDEGDIWAQATVNVLPGDTPDTLAARVLVKEHRLLVATVARLCRSLQRIHLLNKRKRRQHKAAHAHQRKQHKMTHTGHRRLR